MMVSCCTCTAYQGFSNCLKWGGLTFNYSNKIKYLNCNYLPDRESRQVHTSGLTSLHYGVSFDASKEAQKHRKCDLNIHRLVKAFSCVFQEEGVVCFAFLIIKKHEGQHTLLVKSYFFSQHIHRMGSQRTVRSTSLNLTRVLDQTCGLCL